MTPKNFWHGVLIVVLSLAIALPVQAQSGHIGPSTGTIVGAIVGVAAALVVVTVIVIHSSSKNRAISGCVDSTENGLRVANEKDKKIYGLSGNTAGIKPGNRVKLHGKKVKSNDANKPPIWEVRDVAKDFGACRP